MARYCAFLRAINVGGHVVKMDRLRAIFEQAGCASVETFTASGNVIFDSRTRSVASLETKAEQQLLSSLGYEVKTFIRSMSEVQELAAYEPFPQEQIAAAHTLSVLFLHTPLPESAQQEIARFSTEHDAFHACGRELFWLCTTKTSDSQFDPNRLAKAIKMPCTMRNITTIRRIATKYST